MWGKQFYHYDVARWLDRRPGRPAAAAGRQHGRNAPLAAHVQLRRDLDARPVGVPVVRRLGPGASSAWRSPGSTRRSPRSSCCCCCASGTCTPTASCRRTSGRFDDVNPPVHAWAALRVFELDGAARLRLPRPGAAQAADELHLVGQPQGLRRQQRLRGRLPRAGQRRPVRPGRGAAGGRRAGAVRRHRLDGDVRAEPARDDAWCSPSTTASYEDLATKFLEHFAYIAAAAYEQGLWDDEDGFFYDVIRQADGEQVPLKVRSVVGPAAAGRRRRSSAR